MIESSECGSLGPKLVCDRVKKMTCFLLVAKGLKLNTFLCFLGNIEANHNEVKKNKTLLYL